MPSGKDILVERVVNGARDTRFQERIPVDSFVVLEEADDDGHMHVTIGTEEDLELVGVEVPAADKRAIEQEDKEAEKEAEAELKAANKEAIESGQVEAPSKKK